MPHLSPMSWIMLFLAMWLVTSALSHTMWWMNQMKIPQIKPSETANLSSLWLWN